MSLNNSNPQVVVVGGGVAGLATAFMIRELGREAGREVALTILERQQVSGGSTRTEIVEGFTCEWGPNGFLDNEPATLDLVKRLDLENHLVRASEHASKRYIYHHGKLHEVPLNPVAFLKSDILPVSAKLRMAIEPVIPAKRNGADETVYEFGCRRLGETFSDYLLDPMVSGIFAGNVRELSLKATFPKMVEMETQYGGLIRAMIAKRKESKRNGARNGGPSGPGAVLTTFRSGMGELTDTLAKQFKAEMRLSSEVGGVEFGTRTFTVRNSATTLQADAVVLACPSYVAADLVGQIDSGTANALREISFAPVDVVCQGFPKQHIECELDGFGVLLPRGEGFRVLGSLWCDAIFPGQAPDGMHLVRTIAGGAHDRGITKLSEPELRTMVAGETESLLATRGEPVFTKVFRHERGIAQYVVGHMDRVAATEKLEKKLPGLFFTGASYRGVSVNGCIKDANRVAREFWATQGVRR